MNEVCIKAKLANKKALIVEALRFFFAAIIALGHFFSTMKGQDYGGFVHCAFSVKFFFVVSGLLMEEAAQDHMYRSTGISYEVVANETCRFIFHKIKRIYTPFSIAWLLTFLKVQILSRANFKVVKTLGLNSVQELLLIAESGIPGNSYLGVAWYISAMIVVMFCTYPLLLCLSRLYSRILGFIIVVR